MGLSNRLKGREKKDDCEFWLGQAKGEAATYWECRQRGWEEKCLHKRNFGNFRIILCSLQRFITKKLCLQNLEFRTQFTASLAARSHSDDLNSQFNSRLSQLTNLELDTLHAAYCPFSEASGNRRWVPGPSAPFSILYFITLVTSCMCVSKTSFGCHSGNDSKCAVIHLLSRRWISDVTRLSFIPQLSQGHQWERRQFSMAAQGTWKGMWSFLFPPTKIWPTTEE